MAMAEVLIFVPLIGLGFVVGLRIGGGEKSSSRFEKQSYIALQMNRTRQPRAGWKIDRSAACGMRRLNRLVDCGTILSLLPSPTAPYLAMSNELEVD